MKPYIFIFGVTLLFLMLRSVGTAGASFKFTPTEQVCTTVCTRTPNGSLICKQVCR